MKTIQKRYGMRHPVRVTITVSYRVAEQLEQRSTEQGRSLSNLAAYLLEVGLMPDATNPNTTSNHVHDHVYG